MAKKIPNAGRSKIAQAVARHIDLGGKKASSRIDELLQTSSPRGKTKPSIDKSRMDRGGGRDKSGRFTGKGGYGKDYEKHGLDEVEKDFGRKVIRKQVRAHVKDSDHHRYYDGLIKNPDGTYTAIEIKGGTATRSAQQRGFDALVTPTPPHEQHSTEMKYSSRACF